MGSTCFDTTRASLTVVVTFGAALSFLIPIIIIIVFTILCVVRSVSLTEGEITQLKVDKVLFNLGYADCAMRAGGLQGAPLTGIEFRLPTVCDSH